MSKNEAKAPPVETFAATNDGSRIEVSLWENVHAGQYGENVNHSVSIRRSYNVDSDWKETTSMRKQDIPVLQYLLAKAYDAAMMRSNADAVGQAS